MAVLPFVLAASLAMVHVLGPRLTFRDQTRRRRWLSFASGTSVAYIFIHLLPELAAGQRTLEESGAPFSGLLESHVWLMALAGLVAFFGLERAAKCSRRSNRERGGEDRTGREVFWLHIVSFAVYNVLIGYLLLHRPESGASAMFLFWLAMLLHFVVNDYALRDHHSGDYRRIGRWALALAVMAGWVLGEALEISESAVMVLLAFIGGGVVLNVLKEELPEERDSSFAFFAAGATAYTLVLLAL